MAVSFKTECVKRGDELYFDLKQVWSRVQEKSRLCIECGGTLSRAQNIIGKR